MIVSYKNPWGILINRDLKKKDLAKAETISDYTIAPNWKRRKCNRRNSWENMFRFKLQVG